MFLAISSYIKNIAIFIIFISFVGIILPSDKYKNYINIVLGFMLMFILINPFLKHFSKKGVLDFTEIYNELGISTNYVDDEKERLEKIHGEIIEEAYTLKLKKEVEGILGVENIYLKNLKADFDVKTGEISKMELYISDEEERKEIQKINIEKISIAEKEDKGEEDIESTEIKKIISDFYNLSFDNIHIKYI